MHVFVQEEVVDPFDGRSTFESLIRQGYPLGLTLSDPRLLEAIGLPSPQAARQAIHRGQFPLKLRRIGQRYVVSLRDLANWVDSGETPPSTGSKSAESVGQSQVAAHARRGRPRSGCKA